MKQEAKAENSLLLTSQHKMSRGDAVSMNPKIFVVAAVVALAAILGGLLAVGPSTLVGLPATENATAVQQAKPLEIELNDIEVTKFSERSATVEVSFKISNPNQRSMIVQTMDYQLYETGYSESEAISAGQIGTRPEGMVEFGSNYYTLLGENSLILRDKTTLTNSGNTPELWSALESNTSSWRVSGDVFYNLSSMTSGQENEVHFEFTK